MNNDSGVANPAGGANLPIINPNSPTNGITPNDLMSTIQEKLLASSGAISSSSSKIEDTISAAIANTEKSGAASKGATSIAYDKKIETANENATLVETAFKEAQRGFATNTAALTDLRKNNEKSIRALEDSKQMALLSSDADTAAKISDLILKKYEFEQDATQKVFNNLVSIGNFGMQMAQEKRLEATQTFNEDSAKSNIALRYGVEVKPGDTFQDVVNRAKPFASKEQQLQLDKMTADLELTKANAKKAVADATKALKDNKGTGFSVSDINAYIANAVSADPTKDATKLKAEFLGLLTNGNGYTPAQRQEAYNAVDAYFAGQAATAPTSSSGSSSQPFKSPAGNALNKVGMGIGSVGQTVLDFIFGAQGDSIFSSPYRK